MGTSKQIGESPGRKRRATVVGAGIFQIGRRGPCGIEKQGDEIAIRALNGVRYASVTL
jgi:hypothetical protein